MTYQLVDDWLDYAGDSATMGKNAGDDLAEGKLTLPLIHALQSADELARQLIRDAVEQRSAERLSEILSIVRSSGALAYTHQAACREAELALACLDGLFPNPYVEALRALTEYSTSRLF